MALSNRTRSLIKKLAGKAVLETPHHIGPPPASEYDPDPSVAGLVRVQGVIDPEYGLVIVKEQARCFFDTLSALQNEPELEHLSRKEIFDELWTFYCDLCVNQGNYRRTPNSRQKATAELEDKLVRPHSDYEVIFELENISILTSPISLSVVIEVGQVAHDIDITISKFDGPLKESWGIGQLEKEDKAWHPARRLVDKPVTIVHLAAGSEDRAVARGLSAMEISLNLLRSSILGSRAFATDRQLRFRWTGVHLARNLSSYRGSSRWTGVDPMDFECDADAKIACEELVHQLAQLSNSPRMRSNIQRGLEWLGTSTTRAVVDDKIVDLCTALECVLTSENDKRKGEAIAFRALLLTGSSNPLLERIRPDRLLALYNLRSRIVHGAERGLSTEHDYYELRNAAQLVLKRAIELLISTPGIRNSNQFLDALETSNRKEEAIQYLQSWQGKSKLISEVLAFALPGERDECRALVAH